jgi:chromate reductase
MTTQKDVVILVGNLQKTSANRKMAHALAALSTTAFKLEIVEIGQLPLYNQDEENAPPAAWQQFRERIKAASAILCVTPEHLSSVPAVLMNALDVGSMPREQNVWEGKPAAIAGVSTGAIGPFNKHRHLREALSSLKIITLHEPEVYLAGDDGLFDDEGQIAAPGTRDLLVKFLQSFEDFVDKNTVPRGQS